MSLTLGVNLFKYIKSHYFSNVKSGHFLDHADNMRHITGLTDHGYNIDELKIGGDKITYVTTGIDVCNFINVVLVLGCTHCNKILFIGSVRALYDAMKIGDIVINEYLAIGVGVNKY